MVKLAVFGLFLVSICMNGNALKCYECTIKDGKACYDPLDTDLIKSIDCRNSSFIIGNDDTRVFQCVYTLDRFRNNQTTILRKCAVKNSDQEYCDIHNNDAVQQGFTVDACKACTGDNCNSSMHITVGTLSLLIPVLAVGIAFLKNLHFT